MERQLIFAIPREQQKENINLNLGIISPMEFPFNLFVNFDNLLNPDKQLVYFFVTLYGSKKIVLWGFYNKQSQKFTIDGACKYSLSQLSLMMNQWKENNFKYSANSVKDRISQGLADYQNIKRMTYKEYLANKAILGYFSKKISERELEDLHPGLLDEFYEGFPGDQELKIYDYLDDLEIEVREYEKLINRTDLDKNILKGISNNFQDILENLTKRFYDTLKFGQFSSDKYFSSLKTCPNLQKCSNELGEGCEVYYYGTDGFLADEDLEAFT